MAGALEWRHILRELSNFCCLPGRAGGSPVVLATIARRMICRPVSLGRLFFCITALINELPGDSVALNRALSDAHRSRIRTLRVPSVPKVRRNDLVGPCDSGKKYKRCCGGDRSEEDTSGLQSLRHLG